MSKRLENLEQYAQETTNKIISILESGNINSNEWSKGWIGYKGCYNVVTNKAYRGMNQFMLSYLPYETPQYATFKQWQSLGCKVKKGERGHKIQIFSINKKEDKKTGEEKTFVYANIAYVFNAAQVEGNIPVLKEFKNPQSTIDQCELFAENCNIKTNFVPQDRAFYSEVTDSVTMPLYDQFKGNQEYYATLFHEYAHATGNKKRVGRKFGAAFGDDDYAFEELVAELSSVFTMQHLGFYDTAIREDHLQYLSSWLKALKNDNTFILKASSKATKGTEWLINQQQTDQVKTA